MVPAIGVQIIVKYKISYVIFLCISFGLEVIDWF